MYNYWLRLLLGLGLISGWLGAQAQGYNNNWIFGTPAGLTFNNGGAPTPLSGSALVSYKGCASVSNAAGVLQAYSNGASIWNRNLQLMPNVPWAATSRPPRARCCCRIRGGPRSRSAC